MKAPTPQQAAETVFGAVEPRTLTVALLLVQDAIRMGQLDQAMQLLSAAAARWGDDPGLTLVETTLLARQGDFGAARQRLAAVKASDATGLVPKMVEGMLELEAGQGVRAAQQFREVIRRCPDYPGVAGLLASVLMPGPNYREVLGALHQRVKPRGYLEIGVETGASLCMARAKRIVGVDPDLSVLRRERIAAHAELYEMTSQEFFERHSRLSIFDDVPLDLVFIDGLHRFEAALADFAAVERWAHQQTVVVMHDALPVAPVYAEAARRTRFWVGDVWKAVYALLRCRPELRIRIIPTVPSGLVVIRWVRTWPRADDSALAWTANLPAFPALEDQEPVWPVGFPLVTNDAEGYDDALADT